MKNRIKMKKALAASLLLSSGLNAWEGASAADKDQKSAPEAGEPKIQQVAVTGSNVLDVLRKQVPSFRGRSNAGSSNANNTNQNTAGGSQVQLRNLDTLILINGRRAAIAAIGGKAFVDVNQIPPSAIERIEVLPDGSSAIYGSDAIGGVVNIILKSNYEGAELSGRYGSAEGGYDEKSASFTLGKNLGDFNPRAANFPGVNFAYWPQPRQFNNDTDAMRGTVGLRGKLGDGWGWEAALMHSENQLEQRQPNLIFKPNLALAIAGGYDANGNYLPLPAATVREQLRKLD